MGWEDKISSMLGKLPDINAMLPGYEFKDGSLKAQVEYSMCDKSDINIIDNVVMLHASDDTFVGTTPVLILTDLSIHIKPPNLMFLAVLNDNRLNGITTEIILPGMQQRVSFMVSSANRVLVKKGTILGHGIFIPFVPANNISFNKKDGTT